MGEVRTKGPDPEQSWVSVYVAVGSSESEHDLHCFERKRKVSAGQRPGQLIADAIGCVSLLISFVFRVSSGQKGEG